MSEPLHRVVVTGASGFVGRALRSLLPASVDALPFGGDDWEARLGAAHLEGATVFHLAGRAHAFDGDEAAFQRDNVAKTRALAQAAVREGASRIVFLSSVKVYGEESREKPFTADDLPRPEDAYGRSKAGAEQVLTEAAAASGLAVTIVRSPLVYGAAARGNLAALLRLADTPWPLPFAGLTAPRSFIHVEDLARALVASGESKQARGRTYVVAHASGASTAEVVALMRRFLAREPRLWHMAPSTLEALAAIAGQRAKAQRLARPLLVDPSAAERELGWKARVSIAQAVEELVRDHRARNKH